jgi:hypothetical protein
MQCKFASTAVIGNSSLFSLHNSIVEGIVPKESARVKAIRRGLSGWSIPHRLLMKVVLCKTTSRSRLASRTRCKRYFFCTLPFARNNAHIRTAQVIGMMYDVAFTLAE